MDLRLELVRAGLAAGYLPESTARLAPRPRGLVPVGWLDFGVITREVGLFWLARRAPSDAARELLAAAAQARVSAPRPARRSRT